MTRTKLVSRLAALALLAAPALVLADDPQPCTCATHEKTGQTEPNAPPSTSAEELQRIWFMP